MGLPVEVNNLMLGSLGGYTVGRSLRFRSSASAYLSRTPASAGNRTTWTWSAWVKRGILGTSNQSLFSADTNSGAGNSSSYIWFTSSDTLAISIAAGTYYLNSSSVYRDPSAWYHIVVAYDTTQATASNRLKLYVNGVQLTAFGTATYPTQNYTSNINNNVLHSLSARVYQSPTIDTYTDCYLAEVNFIDGQALTPSSFGAYDTNGVWQPKKYSGTYGTNGFYLPFSNTTSTTTLVQDSSGNGNNWTPNNISLTAGTTYDSMIDSPTVSASASNYAVLNPLLTGGVGTPSQGNLTASATGATMQSSFPMKTGKWYTEVTIGSVGSQDQALGITSTISTVGFVAASGGYGWGVLLGRKWVNGSVTTGFATATANDVVGFAFNADTGQLDVYKNNVSVFSITGIPTGVTYNFNNSAGGVSGSDTLYWNFGQRPFTYTPPTGFVALNTNNLPTPTIPNGAAYFGVPLYTGSSAGGSITGLSFQPDFVWTKDRSVAEDHELSDSVRGGSKILYSNLTSAETSSAQNIISFDSGGFTYGTNYATNGKSYVGWLWKAGGTGVTNTSGTITSTVSANPTAGFSIVTYTGNSTAGATIGHGLGVAPNMIITKTRNTSLGNWGVYHSSVGANYGLNLNNTIAATAVIQFWNNTAPTSSVFSVGTSNDVNGASTYVAYCFAAVSGYSAFGSYSANGSTDGPFIYTGFRPRFILSKRTDSSTGGNWQIEDTSRATYNAVGPFLRADTSDAEGSGTLLDILSNGFKLRTTDTGWNASGGTYIYAAFAENPLKYSRAR